MMSKNDVLAGIVTYNRHQLLVRCIKAVCNQTCRPREMIVIDNGSVEPVVDYLIKDNEFELKNECKKENILLYKKEYEINIVRFNDNVGSALAFESCFRLFYETKCKWLWIMDDDGYPEKNSLEALMVHISEFNFLNSLVIDEKNKDDLAFSIKYENRSLNKTNLAICKSDRHIIKNTANPFNGTLIKKEVIYDNGFPLGEMTGWGVEVEYLYRCIKNAQVATITNSIHYHPKSRIQYQKFMMGKLKVKNNSNDIIQFIDIRNTIYTLVRHRGIKSFIKFVFLYLLFFISKPNFKEAKLFALALIDGITGNFKRI